MPVVSGLDSQVDQDAANWYLRPTSKTAFPGWEVTTPPGQGAAIHPIRPGTRGPIQRLESAPTKQLGRFVRYKLEFDVPTLLDVIVLPKGPGVLRAVSNGVDVIPERAVREYVMAKANQAKPEKVLTCFFLTNKLPTTDAITELDRFSRFFSIDSHPVVVQGRPVLVTSVCEGTWGPLTPMGRHLHHEYVVTLVGHLPDSELENEALGWGRAATLLESWFQFPIPSAIGLVVDANFSDLRDLSSQRRPVFRNYYMPDGWSFVFATSSSAGLETLPNAMIKSSDRFNQLAAEFMRDAENSIDEWLPASEDGKCLGTLLVTDSKHGERFGTSIRLI